MTDDVRLRLGNAEPVEGKPAFVVSVNAFIGSVGGFRHEVLNVWSDGDALIAEFDVHYTRLDGDEVTVPCCNVFRLRDGLVAEYRSYIDATPVYSLTSRAACVCVVSAAGADIGPDPFT